MMHLMKTYLFQTIKLHSSPEPGLGLWRALDWWVNVSKKVYNRNFQSVGAMYIYLTGQFAILTTPGFVSRKLWKCSKYARIKSSTSAINLHPVITLPSLPSLPSHLRRENIWDSVKCFLESVLYPHRIIPHLDVFKNFLKTNTTSMSLVYSK